MAKYGSSSFGAFLADGRNLLAASLKSFSFKTESITERSDGLGDSSESHTPVGVTKATITQDGGFFENATNTTHAAWAASAVTTRILSWAPYGNTVGKAFMGALGAFKASYEVKDELDGLTKANATYTVSGVLDKGVIVQEHAAITADGNNTAVDYTLDPAQRTIPITSNSMANPSVVTTTVAHGLTSGDIILIAGVATSSPTINGERTVTVISTTTFSVPVNTSAGAAGTGGSFVKANSTGGGVGYQHVSAFSGFSGYIGKIRDSADDSTYADWVTFVDAAAAPEAQRIEVAGVVDRYLRYSKDVTGSGSITLFAGATRTP